MHTPTHLLIGAAVLARPQRPWSGAAALAGAFLPDLPMFVMYGWARFVAGLGDRDIWPEPDGLYWQPLWQTWTNAGHSLPLFIAVLAVAMLVKLDWLKIFALSGLLHIAFDFPVHREDGHAHLWPFSNWKFVSPVSYWDVDHYGAYVGPIELAIVIGTIVVLWRRYVSWVVRSALGVALLTFVAVPAYFILTHH